MTPNTLDELEDEREEEEEKEEEEEETYGGETTLSNRKYHNLGLLWFIVILIIGGFLFYKFLYGRINIPYISQCGETKELNKLLKAKDITFNLSNGEQITLGELNRQYLKQQK